MMQEGDHDHYFLWKKYKVNAKLDQDMFNIKYQLQDQQNFSDNVSVKSNRSRGSKHPSKKKILRKTSSKTKLEEAEADLKAKKSRWKEKPRHHLEPTTFTAEQKQPSSEELTFKSESEELRLDQQTNRQLSKQQLIQNRLKVHKQSLDELEKTSSQQSQSETRSYLIEDEYSSQSSEEDQENPTVYRQYKDLNHIEESRAKKESKYFKGRVQFSEEVKWSAKIISNEVQGILVVEGTHLNRALHEDEVYFTIIEVKKLETMCSVIGIAKRRSASIVGKIDVSKEHSLYVCKPINKRINKLTIKEESIKQQWIQRFDNYYFLVEFVEWHHSKKYPTCRLVEEVGLMGDIEVESKALLTTHGVEYQPYTKADKKKIIDSFGESFKSGEFSIPEAERKGRKDFRRWKVFIIKDSSYNIALSVYPLKAKSPGNFLKKTVYQINVHFIDVAYFAEESSLLNQFLKKRITSFDMIYRQLPLLPQPILSAASFEVHKERMTISVCIQVDQEGNIIDSIKIGRSLVQPGCILTNEQIMKIITQQQVPPEQYKNWNCGLTIFSQISSYIGDVKLIHKLMSKVRSNRIAQGAFSFDTTSKTIRLDDKYNPVKYELTNKNEAYFLVHQCLIAAQQKIGEYLFKNLKEKAILYRHKFPGQKKLEKLKELAVKIGHPILENKIGEFHREINHLLADPKVAPHLKEVIRYEILVFLEEADYFQTESFDPKAWNNYIINIPIYSHCAAPTIRYGDTLVQRQLLRAISKQQWKQPETETTELLEQCNKYRQIAKRTKNQCEKILLCHFVKNNNVVTSAVIIGLERWGVKLCIPSFGFKTSIKFSKIAGLRVVRQDCELNRCRVLKMEYKTSEDNSTTQFLLKQLSQVQVKINSTTNFPLNLYVTLIISDPKDPVKKTLIV